MARHKILWMVAAVTGVVIVIGLAGGPTRGTDNKFTFDAAKLTDTAVWTKVNAEPYRLSVWVDTLCRMPMAEDYQTLRKENPHAGSYITVYVNNTGRESMLAKEVQTFPQGSVIVKQKIGNQIEGGKTLLYTIMRKREPGFNPTVGDWEFAVVGANGKDVQGLGKLETCQTCHKQKKDSDYIFRTYFKSN